MKIAHSIGVRFAGDGLGYIAYQRTIEVYRCGFLKKVIAPSFALNEIDNSYYTKLAFSQVATAFLSRFTPLSEQYLIRDKIFDWNASLNIPDADIFHGWSSQALFSIRKAKAKGQITFLERPNSHPSDLFEIMSEEYKRNSLDLFPTHPILLKTQLQECEEADFIVVPSNFVYQSFLERGFDPGKLTLVPFGVDNKRFLPRPRPANDNTFRVVFTGQIGMRKGVHYLLDAWSQLKLNEAELILIGWLHPDMVNILKRYTHMANIVIKNFTPNPETIYPLANVCIFPSLEDGFGLVVLEAMACGCPVVITENTGAKDIVTQGEDGFIIQIKSVEAIKDKILYFYEKRQEGQKMGEAALKKASLNTWGHCAEKLFSAYKKAT